MQQGTCNNPGCPAALTNHCLLTHELDECEHWQLHTGKTKGKHKATASQSENGKATKQTNRSGEKGVPVAWSGNALTLNEIELVSRSSPPVIIATVGQADAGKTTFLGLLHTLLLRGQVLRQHAFARSITLLGWEKLAVAWRFRRGGVRGSTPTPDDPDYYSLLHWSLRQPDQQLREVLFPDAGGEVFNRWAVEAADPNVANVRWIIQHADAFLFFVDCQALAERRNPAFVEVVRLATRLRDYLSGRPVIVLWSRADYIARVAPEILERVRHQLQQRFGDYSSFEISYDLAEHPATRQLNMLEAIDDVLAQVEARRWPSPFRDFRAPNSQDTFLLYRGK